jgi:hypothetical protein
MKVYADGHKLAVWAFLVVAMVGSINLIAESRDTLLLFDSIKQVAFTLSNMTLHANDTGGSAVILMELRAENPVDYGGLTIAEVSISYYFFSGNASIFRGNSLGGGWNLNRALAPHGSSTLDFTLRLGTENSTSLYSFYEAHNRSITADASFQVLLNTSFLSVFTGPTLYQRQQNLTLT